MAYAAKPITERFWPKVSPEPMSGCWLWTGSVGAGGYGRIFDSGKKLLSAHRLSWSLTFGDAPGDLDVLHRCDQPSCVNPGHLFLGTARDNMADMKRKGRRIWRGVAGEANVNAKLSSRDVEAIRARHGDVSAKELAAEFGVSPTHVYDIVHRKWRSDS